jgi:hypothetical protein
MQGTIPLSPLIDSNEPQLEPIIPVARLADGARLLICGMRLWNKALADRTCVFAVTHHDFSVCNCKASVRYLDEMMCLFHVASRRPMAINSVQALDATKDELRVATALRLIAENKHEQASYHLRDLVRGPLNFSIIRACADIAATFTRQKLTFHQKPKMTLTNP